MKFLIYGSLALLIFQASYGSEVENKTQELHALTEQIHSLKQTLQSEQDQVVQIHQDLSRTDKAIGAIAKQITKLNEEVTSGEEKLQLLQTRQQKLNGDLNRQRKFITKQIKAAYRLGKHEYLQLLLNQQDPGKLDRSFTYFSVLNKTRLSVLKNLKATLAKLLQVHDMISAHKSEITKLRDERTAQQSSLQQYKQQRSSLLASLTGRIQTHTKELSLLMTNKKALEYLIVRLQAQASLMNNAASFIEMQGRMPMPTIGPVVQHFWSKIAHVKMHSGGIVIAAKVGNPVRAIYPGRVVFSDWISGYGLMIIIQHNREFMSVYGHNQSLYKKEGEFVGIGDLIATVGKSGGAKRSGLYFEIRRAGKPVNPERWVKE